MAGRARSARIRSNAAANSSASFARITPRLPDRPTGFRTTGNAGPGAGRWALEADGGLDADTVTNSGDGRPAPANAARERRLSLLASAPPTECHGRPIASAA